MLSAGARPSETGLSSTGHMGYNSHYKWNSMPQKNSKIMKETALLTQAAERPTCPEMPIAKRCLSKPYVDLPHGQRRHESECNLVLEKYSDHCPKTTTMKATKDDELVRFMSNVPCYLQRVEKKEDMQGKALNMGVLDWGRLESYKCNQRGISAGISNNATLPCRNLSTKTAKKTPVLHSPIGIETPYGNKQNHSNSSKNNIAANGDFFRNDKLSSQGAPSSHDVESGSDCLFDEHKKAAQNYRSSGTTSSDKTLDKSKWRELDYKVNSIVDQHPSIIKSKRVPRRPKESTSSYKREAEQAADEFQEVDVKRKPSKKIVSPNTGASKVELTNGSSSSIKEKHSIDSSRTKNQMELPETAVDFPSKHHTVNSKNIVLLLPRSHKHVSDKEALSSATKQPRIYLDGNGTKQNFSADAFSDKEGFSTELHDEIPHSCPLPSRAETGIENLAPTDINTLDDQASSNSTSNPTSETLDETLKKLNREAADSATRKGRHPSPHRRFSFSSLSRMTRSFSFKENASLPQLNSAYGSVKSGPVVSTSSAGMDNSNREKETSHVRARSSPLRRILDPLLPKFWGKTQPFLDETEKERESQSSSFKPTMVAEMPECQKPEASSIHAQLVLTTSNGHPLFRFVTNNSIIIAAPVKNALAPGKDGLQCNYVLYAIDEIKKKNGSWINQASKEKTCFMYNVVGEMKLNSSSSLDLSGENFNVVKESVLFGVEPRQTGQALPKGTPNTELAAVILRNNIKETEQSDKEEYVQNNSFTVILPGGIHSLPKIGAPSSLIHRWKSGGSCDCGGWDIGCQLQVLSNESPQPKLCRTFSSFLKSDCLELFVQGETQQRKAIFSMAPIEKGKYSVEFEPSISLIQAFFIGVSVISSQTSCDLAEDDVLEEKALNGIGGLKAISTTVRKDARMRYTPTPPVSPVGRV